MNDLKKVIYKYSLINALKHKGTANEKAVIGSIMASEPDLRSNSKKIIELSNKIVNEINEWDTLKQTKELDILGGVVEEKKKVEEKGLKDLPNVQKNTILRFAPNPSGPLHIGHARASVLNALYAEKYNGKMIIRIEDTDPKRIYNDAYEMIIDDLKWLGISPDDIIIQSDRFEIYNKYAEELIDLGQGYICTCNGDEFKKLKDQSIPCPCRSNTIEHNQELWKNMPNQAEGSMVLRVKTDINHKNPAIRDWVAMRIVDAEHPRVGYANRVYPMMNFSVTIDDHLLNITHVLRGKDHLANSDKQTYLYNHFGWDVPEFIHYGRLKMDDIELSTSKTLKGIEEGVYSGWDDPRLGTLRAIARRGINPKSISSLMEEIGIKISDSIISWKKIYGLNRSLLEKTANRYFFISEPVKVDIKDIPSEDIGDVLRPLHPDFLDRGNRVLDFNGSVYLEKNDLVNGSVLRLMDAVNVNVNGVVKYNSSSFEDARSITAKIVHWVPVDSNISAEVIMPDNILINGFCEISCDDLTVGDVIQLERFGFVKVDGKGPGWIRFYYAHR